MIWFLVKRPTVYPCIYTFRWINFCTIAWPFKKKQKTLFQKHCFLHQARNHTFTLARPVKKSYTLWQCAHVDALCKFASLLSHRGDGLHMHSVFTALKEIMTTAENPRAISLRSHLSVSLCVSAPCVWRLGVCMRVHVCYLSKPLGVPCIFASMWAHREHHTHVFMLSRKKIQPHFPFARQSKSEELGLC